MGAMHCRAATGKNFTDHPIEEDEDASHQESRFGLIKKAADGPLSYIGYTSEEKQDPKHAQHERQRAMNHTQHRLHGAQPTEQSVNLQRHNDAECGK